MADTCTDELCGTVVTLNGVERIVVRGKVDPFTTLPSDGHQNDIAPVKLSA